MKRLEEFRKFSKKNPPPPEKMVEYTAHALVEIACHHAFKLFRNRKFRRLVDFDHLEQIEQDRIFNELVVTAILLIMFTFEAPDLRVPPEFKEFLFKLRDEVPKAHRQQLKEIGIEKKYLKIWRKLIELRYEEYQKDKQGMREAAMELEAQQAPLTTKSLEDIHVLLPAQTLAVGALFHIRRGKGEPEDPLFQILLKWVGKLYLLIRVTAEGGKITWWRKAMVRLRRLSGL